MCRNQLNPAQLYTVKYRRLGNSGVRISEIALGSWLTFGKSLDDAIATEIIETAYDYGISFFDTSDNYAGRKAEKVLGKALSRYPRNDLFIASKVFFPVGDGPNDKGLSRKHIFEELEASLAALNTNYLDLYQCHRYDYSTPLEETVNAMIDLIRSGKILYWGVSMWSASQIKRACKIADRINGYRPISNQVMYNFLDREVEYNGIQSVCRRLGVGLLAFSPLAEGLLTGKYQNGVPANSRAANENINNFIKKRLTERNMTKSAKIVNLAQKLDTSPAKLSLAWLLNRQNVNSVIIGVSHTNQLSENIAVVDHGISISSLESFEVSIFKKLRLIASYKFMEFYKIIRKLV